MVLVPDDLCLDCLRYLDHYAFEREGTPYITGVAPSDVAIVPYSVVAAFEFDEFPRPFFPGSPAISKRTSHVFDGIAGIGRRVALQPERACGICVDQQDRGDSITLPCRQDR